MATFEELIDEAATASIDGWDFAWLDGRATEQRPSWGYARLMARRLAGVCSALDIQTGGGEVVGEAETLPPLMVATEAWPPNLARATERLHPRGAAVVADEDEPPLPFADNAFELVTSRHPVTTWWAEIARVLRPGGSYLSQQIGPENLSGLSAYFLGELPAEHYRARRTEDARGGAEQAGLEVLDLRTERLRVEFFDIGAVVYFLRKVVWTVPDFSVERYRETLHRMHEHIQREGSFVTESCRFLIEARKP
ncbi:class I SAM-dependent methyltransferase [Sciscionella marina]|uniref:class I SAM-dependent methyltransferase n=1 Tax=Sciscionella marina TaxID=508770 RepID=UPI000378B03F|nr:class I SAM-dependent methyltransferase [Sciscionella marina]